MRVKFELIVVARKIVRVLNFALRIGQASGSGALIRIRCVPHRFHPASAFVALASEDSFQRHRLLCDRHTST